MPFERRISQSNVTSTCAAARWHKLTPARPLRPIALRALATLFVSLLFWSYFSTSANAATVIDWSKRDIQSTDASCGEIEFRHMADNHAYSFLVRGGQSMPCIFHEDGLKFFYPSNYGPTIAGKRTFFGFARFGSDVLVTWSSGY